MSPERNFRMDFILETISTNDKTKTIYYIMKPNPKRYEWKTVKGKRVLYDKFDHVYFPEEVYQSMAKQIKGMTVWFQRSKIDNAEKYIKSREKSIEKMVKGSKIPSNFSNKPEEFLESLSKHKLNFVIISIDLVGSTNLSTNITPKDYLKLISVVLYELAGIIPKFNGYVLKYTGDGLIAYFPEPSFISKNDLAINCAVTMRSLIYRIINPIFKENNLPQIGVRIGLDAGEAYVEVIGNPATKQHKDIIGKVVNLSTKIRVQAKPGEIYLGDTVERNLHTYWREICEPIKLNKKWNYRDKYGIIYKVHKLSNKKKTKKISKQKPLKYIKAEISEICLTNIDKKK